MNPNPNPVAEHLRRHWLPYALAAVLAVVLVVVLFRNSQRERAAETRQQTLREEARQFVGTRDQQQLALTTRALAWAVSNALLREKSDEINNRFNALVREKGVRELLLVDPAGTVTLSTNKKNQGTAFTGRYPAALLGQPDLQVSVRNGQYELSAPVMSLEKRLGTVVLVYGAESPFADSTAVR